MKKTSLLFFVAALLSIPSFSSAQDQAPARRAALGINYPGLSYRHPLGARYAAELKVQSAGGVTLAGARLYRFLNPAGGITPLLALEADYLSFKGSDSKGSGMAMELAVGGEMFMSRSLSLQLDLGPALIMVKDGDTGLSVSGIEYVANFGINLYLGGGGVK